MKINHSSRIRKTQQRKVQVEQMHLQTLVKMKIEKRIINVKKNSKKAKMEVNYRKGRMDFICVPSKTLDKKMLKETRPIKKMKERMMTKEMRRAQKKIQKSRKKMKRMMQKKIKWRKRKKIKRTLKRKKMKRMMKINHSSRIRKTQQRKVQVEQMHLQTLVKMKIEKRIINVKKTSKKAKMEVN